MTSQNPDKTPSPSEALERTLRPTSALTLDQFRKVLRERARLLAQEEHKDELSESEYVHVLQFFLAGELYAFEGKFVREVRVAQDITPIPCTPSFVSGVVNLRGEILTVLDTKQLLGLPPEDRPTHKLVVLRHAETQIGFLIDEIVGVSPVALKELQRPLTTMPAEQARRISGLTGDPMVLIDVEALLVDPRIVVDEEVFD